MKFLFKFYYASFEHHCQKFLNWFYNYIDPFGELEDSERKDGAWLASYIIKRLVIVCTFLLHGTILLFGGDLYTYIGVEKLEIVTLQDFLTVFYIFCKEQFWDIPSFFKYIYRLWFNPWTFGISPAGLVYNCCLASVWVDFITFCIYYKKNFYDKE